MKNNHEKLQSLSCRLVSKRKVYEDAVLRLERYKKEHASAYREYRLAVLAHSEQLEKIHGEENEPA